MFQGKQLSRNPATQHVQNWLAFANAEAERQMKLTGKYRGISVKNAQREYAKVIKALSDFGNPSSTGHNAAYNAIKSEINDRDALNAIENLGQNFVRKGQAIANAAMQAGLSPEAASVAAFNSVSGDPNFDHFANLAVRAEPLYENKTFVSSFIDEGDAFTLPVEVGSGSVASRFRAPILVKSGSAKTYQGDQNPLSEIRPDDSNGSQLSQINEFKDAKTEGENFYLDQTQRDQFLGYQNAVSPGLAGAVLQNFLNTGVIEDCMRNAELNFVDGQQAGATYTPYIGGNYGLLSPNVALELASAAAESPLAATASDWVANPTKLIQQINNYWYKPVSTSVPLSSGLDVTLMYKDIVRLLNLYASLNVNTMAKSLTLYVPTQYYGFSVNYLGTGTFNRQLNEAVQLATGGLVQNIQVKPSGLLGARTNIFNAAQVNYFALVAHGAPNGKKGCIFPGMTSLPQISSQNVSQDRMTFRVNYTHGGPMVLQTGQVFLLKFSVAA